MSEVTSEEIKKALAKKHGNREFFIAECKNGPTGVASGKLLQIDGVAIYKSWANPRIVGYEIKVSRSDFLRDNKYTQYMEYCHEFYFIVPNGMVQRQEVEENIGLMWYNPKTEQITTKRKAIWRDIEVDPKMLLYIIMNRLESDRYPFHSSQADYWKEWLENKVENREMGYRVKSKLLDENRKLENLLSKYDSFKRDRDEHREILKIMDRNGIYSLTALEEAFNRPYPPEVDSVKAQLERIIKQIDELKNKV